MSHDANDPVSEALKYSADSRALIWSQLLGTLFKQDPRTTLAFAYGSMTLEHQRAIHMLVSNKLSGSALALLRPQIETVFRGLWAIRCATDAQVEAIGQDGAEPFPPFRQMAVVLDAAYGAGDFFQGIAVSRGTLNGFTHSGLEQLGRRFQNDGKVEPNYSDTQIVTLLRASAEVSLVLFDNIFMLTGHQDKAAALREWLGRCTNE